MDVELGRTVVGGVEVRRRPDLHPVAQCPEHDFGDALRCALAIASSTASSIAPYKKLGTLRWRLVTSGKPGLYTANVSGRR